MRKKAITAIVMLASVLCSCSKEGAALFKGNYSFKTSGTICARQVSEPADTLLPDDVTIKLTVESGQMDITPRESGSMLVSMNVTGGDMLVYEAETEGDELIVSPDVRNMPLNFPYGKESRKDTPAVLADVTVSGSGHRYGNIILFRFTYQGTFKVDGTEYAIYSSDVDCRAKLNE